MNPIRRERLAAAGVDVEDALARFLGSEAMLERFWGKFLEDQNYARLEEAVRDQDWTAALAASHTLKGMCGNLSLRRLFLLFTRQVAAFRSGDYEAAAAQMEEIAGAYEAAVSAIRSAPRTGQTSAAAAGSWF